MVWHCPLMNASSSPVSCRCPEEVSSRGMNWLGSPLRLICAALETAPEHQNESFGRPAGGAGAKGPKRSHFASSFHVHTLFIQ